MISQNRFCLLPIGTQKSLYIFLTCFALGGCAGDISSTPTPDGAIVRWDETSVPGGGGHAGIDALDTASKARCPAGYAKIGEQAKTTDHNITIWQVRCL